MIAVLDVSAAIQILLNKEKKDHFLVYYRRASWVIAPDLYVNELTNVLWKYNKAKILEHDSCQQLVEDGVALIDDYFSSIDLWKEVLGESIKNHHSAYDLFYAILARRNDGTLISHDKRLIALSNKLKIANSGN